MLKHNDQLKWPFVVRTAKRRALLAQFTRHALGFLSFPLCLNLEVFPCYALSTR